MKAVAYVAGWVLLVVMLCGFAYMGMLAIKGNMDRYDACHRAGGVVVRSGDCVERIEIP